MFKVGDRVRCIDGRYSHHILTEGEEYTVINVELEVTGTYITVDGIGRGFSASRFELVEPQFKRGDKVLVWDWDEKQAYERIFLAYIEGARSPYVCVMESQEKAFYDGADFEPINCKHAKPILPTKQTVTLELTDEQLEKIRGIINEK